MSGYTLTRPPYALRRAKLDNVAIVPASLLPFKAKWQEIANNLPEGDVLIIMPASDTPQKATLRRVAAIIQSKGYSVTTLSAERFAAQRRFSWKPYSTKVGAGKFRPLRPLPPS